MPGAYTQGETNSLFLVLHPSSDEHTVNTVGTHLNILNPFGLIRLK